MYTTFDEQQSEGKKVSEEDLMMVDLSIIKDGLSVVSQQLIDQSEMKALAAHNFAQFWTSEIQIPVIYANDKQPLSREEITELPILTQKKNMMLDRYIDLTYTNERTGRINQILQCKTCAAQFTKRANMRDHLHTHFAEFNYFCNYCSKGFVQRGNMLRHEGLRKCQSQ